MAITRATNLAGLGTVFDALTDGGGLSISGLSTFSAPFHVGFGGTVITTTDAGLVGIGSTIPTRPLDILKEDEILLNLARTTSSSGVQANLEIKAITSASITERTESFGPSIIGRYTDSSNTGRNLGSIIFKREESGVNGEILLRTYANTATSEVSIDSTGAVGIGSSSTGARLFAIDDGSSPIAAPIANFERVNNHIPSTNLDPNLSTLRLKDHSDNVIIHATNQTIKPLFTLNGQGQVGVGTTSPFKGTMANLTGLDCHGELWIGGAPDLPSVPQYSTLRFRNATVGQEYATIRIGSDERLYTEVSGQERLSIDTTGNIIANTGNGNVGIATTLSKISSFTRLNIKGGLEISQDTSSSFLLSRESGGQMTCEHVFASSSNSPNYTFGQNLLWTGELAGVTVRDGNPYYENYAPVSGKKEFGFISAATKDTSFTSGNLIKVLVLTDDNRIGVKHDDPNSAIDLAGTDDEIRWYRDDRARYGGIRYNGSNFIIKQPFGDNLQVTDSSDSMIFQISSTGIINTLPTANDTTANAANVFISSVNGQLSRSTSSIRYKTQVEDLESSRSDAILGLRPVWYRSTTSNDNQNWSWYGLIAEEVAEIEPRLVFWGHHDSDYEEVLEQTVDSDGVPQFKVENVKIIGIGTTGETVVGIGTTLVPVMSKVKKVKEGVEESPQGVQYDRLTVLLLDVIKRQKIELDDLKSKVQVIATQVGIAST